ncbi:MAG TPA: hypothetical protein IAC38_04150 [Candidatus Caccovivens faecavium]|nr:hypothetical protein [Candidatus Caccovivens faecavium]
MKKGILKALAITALVAVSAVGGLALGAEISNGFETTYSESAYEDYGDKKQQIGYEQGKQEGLEEGFENGQQVGHEAGYQEGQQAGYENGYTAGEQAGYEAGLAEGYTEEDIQEAVNHETQIWSEFLKLKESNNSTRFNLPDDKQAWSSLNNNILGLFIFDENNGTLDKITDDGYGFCEFFILEDKNSNLLELWRDNNGIAKIENNKLIYIVQSNDLLVTTDGAVIVDNENHTIYIFNKDKATYISKSTDSNLYNDAKWDENLYIVYAIDAYLVNTENCSLIKISDIESEDFPANLIYRQDNNIIFSTSKNKLYKLDINTGEAILFSDHSSETEIEQTIYSVNSDYGLYYVGDTFYGINLETSTSITIYENITRVWYISSDSTDDILHFGVTTNDMGYVDLYIQADTFEVVEK